MKKFRLALIQVNAGRDWKKNLARIDRLCREALSRPTDLIALPETFASRDRPSRLAWHAGEVTPQIIQHFQAWACRSQTAFLLGSVVEPSASDRRFYNTSILIDERGKVAARYRKIHLFDIGLKGRVVTSESRHIRPGRRIVIAKVKGVPLGLSICYDLRFPELYRQQARQGARILLVPANFTYETGKAHWETLLRARAIENQAFVAAPGQSGTHPVTGIRSWGHSMVIDPWGKVLKKAGARGEKVLRLELDLASQERLRRDFPVLKHRRLP